MQNKKMLSNEILSEIRSELDDSLGGINASIEVLNAVQIETGRMEDEVTNMGSDITSMGLMMNDIQHKIVIVNNLLNHTLKALKEYYNEADSYKQELYKYEVKENTPDSSKNQG